MIWRSVIAALALASTGAACSPPLDWRVVRPDGAGLQALFPCKPVRHERHLSLAGTAVKMTLLACTAGGATYAVGFADVREPRQVAPALSELLTAATRNVGAVQASSVVAVRVPGMTPNPQASLQVNLGQSSDGQRRALHAAAFAKGTLVFQATVVGERPDTSALEQFFDSLSLAV